MKKFSNILWGLLFIGLGVIIGLNSFGITNINFFFDGWWTLFIIIPCTIELFRSRDKTGNLIGIATGVALLLACQGILTFDMLWKLALPTILVIIGLSLVFKDMLFSGKKRASFKRASDRKGQEDNHFTAFGSKNVRYDNQVFYGNDLTAVLGTVTCDLRNAIIEEDVIINANATFGGIEILVPPTVNVEMKSTAIFGGVNDKRRNNTVITTPTIYVSGLCLFGGVDIK